MASLLFLLALFVGALASGNRAVAMSCTGCQLAEMPLLRAALFGELNYLTNLEIKWQSGATTTLVVYDINDKEIKSVTFEKDVTLEDFLLLLTQHGVSLDKTIHPKMTNEPIATFEFNNTEFLLYGNKVLRAEMLATASSLGGRPLMLENPTKDRAISKWLKSLKLDDDIHTSAYSDDGLYFWKYALVLPSRDRGRKPWAKREPSRGDCVVLSPEGLKSGNCNSFALACIEKDVAAENRKKIVAEQNERPMAWDVDPNDPRDSHEEL